MNASRLSAVLALVGVAYILSSLIAWSRPDVLWYPNEDGTGPPLAGDAIIRGHYREGFAFTERKFGLRIKDGEWQMKWNSEPNTNWRWADDDFLKPRNNSQASGD